MFFSVIIPFQKWSGYIAECLEHFEKLSDDKYELILLPDEPLNVPKEFDELPIKVISTGKVSPSIKRDIGAEKSIGDYLAFIDDDAYPDTDWLDVATEFFTKNPTVSAIGGPGITPGDDPIGAKISGAVFLSKLTGGFPERYIPTGAIKQVDDWPSVNLIVSKKVFQKVGGFDSNYWPGEDSKLCLDIIESGGTIFYLPKLIVFHHRRPGIKSHLRQVGNYGFHRGLFFRKGDKNSRKLAYLIPTLFVFFLVAGFIFSLFYEPARPLYTTGLAVYVLVILSGVVDIMRKIPAKIALASIPLILMTHIYYGVRFAKGMITVDYSLSLGR